MPQDPSGLLPHSGVIAATFDLPCLIPIKKNIKELDIKRISDEMHSI